MGAALITGVLLLPGLHGIFKVADLSSGQLLTMYALAFLNLPVIQFLKMMKN